ncbi:unnamed protein product [Larinioides sclopetarius]|uniref:Uncharacterized protein n=1 Tax=Larinioides sclopetarius TaxID=280406 RepID=A0AAV2AKA2_9ARAC
MGIEKSHVKKKRKNIYTEKTASLLTKDDDLISVLKPVHCYQSPHQSKKFKSRKKTAPDGHGKIECDEKVDCQPKKQVSRTKKVHEVKQKAKEENEAEIEKLNEHFSELEKMDLCIE